MRRRFESVTGTTLRLWGKQFSHSLKILGQVTHKPRVNPYTTLLVNVLPIFAEDAHEMVVRIMDHAKDKGEEIDMNDGFELYKQLTSTRRYFAETLPEYDLASPSHFAKLLC